MGEELEFRTAVGGYKKDDVLEYVENMNDKLSQMSRAHEEETKRYQSRIQELEELLRQEEENSAALAEDQDKRLEGLARENSRLQDALTMAEEKQKFTQQEYLKAEQNKITQPSLAKSFKNKTTNNILPRTGDESSLSIIALGAVIGLAGIGAILKRYE